MPEIDHMTMLGAWCQEAVQEFGADWPKIRAYIQSRIDSLPEERRQAFLVEIEGALRSARQEPALNGEKL